jgi:hypothetical protein
VEAVALDFFLQIVGIAEPWFHAESGGEAVAEGDEDWTRVHMGGRSGLVGLLLGGEGQSQKTNYTHKPQRAGRHPMLQE